VLVWIKITVFGGNQKSTLGGFRAFYARQKPVGAVEHQLGIGELVAVPSNSVDARPVAFLPLSLDQARLPGRWAVSQRMDSID
jgi:hypothetical protein